MKRSILRSISAAVVAGSMMLCMTAPVYAESASGGGTLTITVHNAEGLPEMTANQFKVYQLFKGTASLEEGVSLNEEDTKSKEMWQAENWNNYSLADIEWGSAVGESGDTIIQGLQGLVQDTDGWAFDEGNSNYFQSVTDAASLAKVLVGKNNSFMQHFADYIADNGYLTIPALETGVLANTGDDDPTNDTLTYTLTEPGYYLLVESENNSAVVSEYILAVLGKQDIFLKGSVPIVDKTIDLSDHSPYGDVAGIGDIVAFKLSVILPKNFEDYETYKIVFHDTLDKGLTFGIPSIPNEDPALPPDPPFADYVITVERGNFIYTMNSSESGMLTEPDGTLPTKDAELTFEFEDVRNHDWHYNTCEGIDGGPAIDPNEGTIRLQAGDVFNLSYAATVNENAVVGYGEEGGNMNAMTLEYSNDPNNEESTGTTPEEKVHVYSFGVDLTKVGDDALHSTGLKDASFTLRLGGATDEDFGMIAKFADNKFVGWDFADEVGFDTLYAEYLTAKDAFDRTPEADRGEGTDIANNLNTALEALKPYLLTSDDQGNLPDVGILDDNPAYDTDEYSSECYLLTEVITPDGYNTMDPVTFRFVPAINEDTGLLESYDYYCPANASVATKHITSGDAEFTSGIVGQKLINEKAPVLPFTGGIGTHIVYAVGAAAVLTGLLAILGIRRKKKED